jgi:hypothetical protein
MPTLNGGSLSWFDVASFGWRAIARLWIAFRLAIDAEIALTASFVGASHV